MSRLKKLQVDDDIVLDVGQNTLTRNGNVIHLTPIETKLLALLMANAGRVVNRDELIQAVWRAESPDHSRKLDVHICWLRQKIEDNPQIPELILTRRGLGYELRL